MSFFGLFVHKTEYSEAQKNEEAENQAEALFCMIAFAEKKLDSACNYKN